MGGIFTANTKYILAGLIVSVFIGCACADALEFDGEVVQLTGAQSGDINWDKSNFGGFCYNLSDGACVGTETLTIADGTLEGPYSDRTIDEDALSYTTQPISREYELHRNLGLTVESDHYGGDSIYWIEFWRGRGYVAIDHNADSLAELLVEFNSTDIKTLAVGEEWALGRGFVLEARDIDLEGEKVWLCLYKNGVELDNEVLDVGGSDLWDRVYTYTAADIGGNMNIPVFSCYVSAVFRGRCSNLVQVKYVFLIDDDVTEIECCDHYGSMEVMTASSSSVTLKNWETIDLDMDSTTVIMGNLSFEVADNDEAIEFYPHLARDVPHLSGGGGFVLDDYQIGSPWDLSEDYSIVAKDVDIGECKARIVLLKNDEVVDERILTTESEAPVSSDSYYSYVRDGTEITNATLKNVLNGVVGLTKVYQCSEVGDGLLVNNESHSFGEPVLDHITVTPAGPLIMKMGDTQVFNVTCYNETAEVSGITVLWDHSNMSVGTIDSSGLFTAVANGTTSITATAYGVTSNTVLAIVGDVARVPGDVTGDGAVNIGDAVLLFNWVSFPNERGTTYALNKPDNANVNGDTTTNIGDAVLLFNWVSFPNERGTTYVLK